MWHLRHSIEMEAFNVIESAIYKLCSVSVSCPWDIVLFVTLRVPLLYMSSRSYALALVRYRYRIVSLNFCGQRFDQGMFGNARNLKQQIVLPQLFVFETVSDVYLLLLLQS